MGLAAAAGVQAQQPQVTVSWGAAQYVAAEGGDPAILALHLDRAPGRTVTIRFNIFYGDSATAADHSSLPSSVVFGASETVRYLLVRAVDDALDDDGTTLLGERLILDIITPANVVVGSGGSRTEVKFRDNDGEVPPTIPRIRAATPRDGAVDLEWDRGLPPGGEPTSFELLVRNLGTVGKSWTVRNIAGTARSLTVGEDLAAIGEALENGARHQFRLQAKNTAGASHRAYAYVTPSADPPEVVGVMWLEDDYAATEGGTAATPTLRLDAAVGHEVTVDLWHQYEGDTSAADVVFPDPFSITIAAGETQGSLTVEAFDDAIPEGSEAVQVGFLGLPEGIGFASHTSRPNTRILLNDNDPSLVARFEHSTYEVREGGSVDVTLLLDRTNPGILGTLNLVRENRLATSADLIGVPPQVTFLPHVTKLTLTLEAPDDADDDDGESVDVHLLGSSQHILRAGSPSSTTITIIDDDDPNTVAFDRPTYTVAEGGSVNVEVRLGRAPGVAAEVTLISGPGGGASAADYRGVPSSVHFAPRQTEALFTVTAAADDELESGEQVHMILTPLPGSGIVPGTPTYAVVHLTDLPVTEVKVAYEPESASAAEGGPAVAVAVVLDRSPGRQVTVPLVHVAEGGATAADYNSSAIPASVTFAATETRKTFTVSATADDVDETGERVRFTFPADPHRLPTGVTVGTPPATTVHLTDAPTAAVSYERDSYTVHEAGDAVTVAVVLDRSPGRQVTVDLTRANQGTATDADYGGVPASVTFAATETRKTFTVTATEDGVEETGESVLLGFDTLPAGLNPGVRPETTLHLAEDPAPPVRVGYEQNSYTAWEPKFFFPDTTGTPALVGVVLDRMPRRSVTVSLTHAPADRATSADYSGVPEQVTFSAMETRKTFTVAALRDLSNEPGESVLLGFGADLPAGTAVGTWPTARVHLRDSTDDSPTRVRFDSDVYTATEGDAQAHVGVSLDRAVARVVTVPLAAQNQGTAVDGDYSGVPASVTFPANQTSGSFTVTATTDTDSPEPGEAVRLVFDGLPSGIIAGAPAAATVKLLDANTPLVAVRFARDSYTAKEGGPPATVAVLLDRAPGRTVTVPLSTRNVSASDGDYRGVPASVTFAATETRKTFTLSATLDAVAESPELVTLSFGALPPDVVTGLPPYADVHLVDAATTTVQVRFERNSYTAREGGPHASVVGLLDQAPGRPVHVRVSATPEDGADSADYSLTPVRLTFGANDTRATIAVHATADDSVETGERVRLRFGTLPAGVSPATPEETTVHLTDRHMLPVTVSFERSRYGTREGGSGAIVGVALDRFPSRPVTVPLTATNLGTTSDADYRGVPASVTFAASATRAAFTVQAVADTVWDPNEAVQLDFTTLPAGVTPGSRPNTQVNLLDPTTRRVWVSFVQDRYTATEGEPGAQVQVQLNEPAGREIVVPLLRTNLGGATGADYTKTPVTVPDRVAFAATEALRTFTVTAHDDLFLEAGEEVRFSLGLPPGGVSHGARTRTTVQLDEQSTAAVRFARDGATAHEGGTGVAVKVLLDRPPGRAVTVALARTNLGGATDADYNHADLPTSLTFAPADTARSFTVTATDDTSAETGESVRFRIDTNLPDGVVLGTPPAMTVHLADAGTQRLQVSFERDRYAAAEGGTAVVAAQLDQTPNRPVEVGLTVTPGDGVTADDYSGIPATITFAAAGATGQSFTVSAVADGVDEELESLQLGFSMLPAAVEPGTHPAATVYLTDADEPPVRVSFELDSYTAWPERPATVAVVLDRAPGRRVTVPLTTTARGVSTSQYHGVPDSVTFEAASTRTVFSVNANSLLYDPGDAVLLGLGTLPPAVEPGTHEQTIVHLLSEGWRTAMVRFERDSYTAREGGPDAMVSVLLDPTLGRTVDVTLTTTEDGASATDYSGIPETVRFAAGTGRVTFTVAATADHIDETDEAVHIEFGTMPAGISRDSPPDTSVHFTDAGTTPVQVRFERYSYLAVEGGAAAEVAVVLDQAPGRTVAVPLTIVHQGAPTQPTTGRCRMPSPSGPTTRG